MQESIVFITGGSGFIGSELIRTLCQKGYKVRALLRSTSSHKNLNDLNFEIIDGGLNDREALEKGVSGADYVIHVAGILFAKSKEEFFKTNVDGSTLLARVCLEKAPKLKRFLFISSLAAAGPSNDFNPIKETDIPKPISNYGESKLHAEIELEKLLRNKIPLTIIRPPIVYGPKDTAMLEFFKIVKFGVIPKLPAQNKEKQKYISMIYVDDLIDGIIRATFINEKHDLEIPKKYFLTNSDVNTISEFLFAIQEAYQNKTIKIKIPKIAIQIVAGIGSVAGHITGKVYPMNIDKWKESQPDYWICSAEAAKKDLDFKAQMPLREGVRKTAKWYLDQKWV